MLSRAGYLLTLSIRHQQRRLGAGVLFKHLDSNGYEEIKTHNHTLENFARVKERWYENEVAKDQIQRLREQLSDANADINDTNHALKFR